MIEITVQEQVLLKKENVFNVLQDVSCYDKWWGFKAKVINDKTFQFHPVSGVSIESKLVEVTENRVIYNYIKGPFRGETYWEFDAKKSTLSYVVNLHPIHQMYGLMTTTNIFKKKHTLDVQKVIKRLVRFIEHLEQS